MCMFAYAAALGCEGRRGPKHVAFPRLRVLGIAQDAGVPQPGCFEQRCTAGVERYVSCLALETHSGVYLFDATPDLPRQLRLLAPRAEPGKRTRTVVDGVFLTHAHMGHYLGLAHFGFESSHADGIPVWGSPRMNTFLADNAPWEQLLELGEIEARSMAQPVELDGATVTGIEVPHRAEYTDTLAYRIEGPSQTALYIPDVDPWSRHADDPRGLFEGVDVAYVDGTFYSGDELPGRDIDKIGHPLIVDTLELLADRVGSGMLDLRFIHLNHTNPALDPRSVPRREIERRGARVAERSELVSLSAGRSA